MEVCGTQTAEISHNGIRNLLSTAIQMISGPGCPVCVTVSAYIDRLIELSGQEGTTVVSFGDLFRVPGSREPGSKRIELRSPDPSCNPYLALAVCLEAGLDGICRKLEPADCINENIYAMSKEEMAARHIDVLPGTLREALDELQKDELIFRALGEIGPKFVAAKKAEWESYSAAVTAWELEQYLYRV